MGIVTPTDELIFFRGVGIPPTIYLLYSLWSIFFGARTRGWRRSRHWPSLSGGNTWCRCLWDRRWSSKSWGFHGIFSMGYVMGYAICILYICIYKCIGGPPRAEVTHLLGMGVSMTDWWFRTFGLFFPSYWEYSSQLTFTPSCFRGVGLNHQSDKFITVY